MVKEVKAAFPNAVIYIGGGAKPHNLKKFTDAADGVIVGSYLKKDGKIFEELDPVRLEEFMNAWREIQ